MNNESGGKFLITFLAIIFADIHTSDKPVSKWLYNSNVSGVDDAAAFDDDALNAFNDDDDDDDIRWPALLSTLVHYCHLLCRQMTFLSCKVQV